jgi:hypothetical protein
MSIEKQIQTLRESLESLEQTKNEVLKKLEEIGKQTVDNNYCNCEQTLSQCIINGSHPDCKFNTNINPKFNEPWMPKLGEKFYYLDFEDYEMIKIVDKLEYENLYYRTLLKNGFIFKTYEQAQQRAKEIKVYNLLKNFSDANNPNNEQCNYYIDLCDSKFTILNSNYIQVGVVYFISREVAEESLRRYKKELEELVK